MHESLCSSGTARNRFLIFVFLALLGAQSSINELSRLFIIDCAALSTRVSLVRNVLRGKIGMLRGNPLLSAN